MMDSTKPELAWLKSEFNLSDVEFKRICDLHAAYMPRCAEMCRRVDQQNKRLMELLSSTNGMTPEIQAAVAEGARIRGECQNNMLAHFLEVSRTMPPEQGRRYLQWILQRTLVSKTGMPAHDAQTVANP